MGTSYDADIVTWAEEQATLLREGRLTEIDIVNIAEESESEDTHQSLALHLVVSSSAWLLNVDAV